MKMYSILALTCLASPLYAQNPIKKPEVELKPTSLSFTIVGELRKGSIVTKKDGKETRKVISDKKFYPPQELFTIPKGGQEKDDEGNLIRPPSVSAPLLRAGKPYTLEDLEQKSLLLHKMRVRRDLTIDHEKFEKFLNLDIKYPNQFQNIYIYQPGLKGDWSQPAKVISVSNEFSIFPKKSFRVINLSTKNVAFELNGKAFGLAPGKVKVKELANYGLQWFSIGMNAGDKIKRVYPRQACTAFKDSRSNIIIYDSIGRVKPVAYKFIRQMELPVSPPTGVEE